MFNGVFFNIKALLNYVGLAIVVSSLLSLRWSPKLNYPLRMINYSGFILVTGGVYWSGGFASNDILWYLVLSVSSLLFISKIDGITMTMLSMCALVGFYIIDIFQLIELPYDPLTRSIHYRFVNAVIIILILFFLVWILVRNNKRLHMIIQNIQASQIRESISQDFHDELGNKLASVVHLSKRLKNSRGEQEKIEMLEVIEHESQQVYDSFRDFIWTNDPNSIIVSSLFMYLTDFNHQFFAHKELHVEGELLSSDSNTDEKVSSNIIRHVVPLFKELMTNIHKHAQATRVDWSLLFSKNQLILEIEDNGVGFDTTNVHHGQGLKSIHKRVIELKAVYELSSNPGKGTKVLLRIDMNN